MKARCTAQCTYTTSSPYIGKFILLFFFFFLFVFAFILAIYANATHSLFASTRNTHTHSRDNIYTREIVYLCRCMGNLRAFTHLDQKAKVEDIIEQCERDVSCEHTHTHAMCRCICNVLSVFLFSHTIPMENISVSIVECYI